MGCERHRWRELNIGTITPATATSATYTAPETLPSPASVSNSCDCRNCNRKRRRHTGQQRFRRRVSIFCNDRDVPNFDTHASGHWLERRECGLERQWNSKWKRIHRRNLCDELEPLRAALSASPSSVVFVAPSSAPSQNPVSSEQRAKPIPAGAPHRWSPFLPARKPERYPSCHFIRSWQQLEARRATNSSSHWTRMAQLSRSVGPWRRAFRASDATVLRADRSARRAFSLHLRRRPRRTQFRSSQQLWPIHRKPPLRQFRSPAALRSKRFFPQA